MSITTTITLVNTSLGLSSNPYKLQMISGGLRGSVGPEGLSAYQVALENGFVGTEAEWLDSLVGPPGTAGDVAWGELIGSISDQADLFCYINSITRSDNSITSGDNHDAQQNYQGGCYHGMVSI